MDDRAVPESDERIGLAVLSQRGGRPGNEDSCGHWRHGERLCCVVADGAGGHGGGDLASRIVVRHILEQASLAPLTRADEVHDLLVDANVQLLRRQSEASSEAERDMRSTVVALFIDLGRGQALWGHAGDSRLYLFREGRLAAQTRDHSVVQAMVDAGVLMPEQMRRHPQRSELHSALGCRPEELMVSAAAEPWRLAPRDAFLLCTDGLWEYVEEAEMSACLERASDPQEWLASLERLVLQRAAESGRTRHDNLSGIAVWIGGA